MLWELSGAGEQRQRRARRLIAAAFVALAIYLLAQTAWVLAGGHHPRPSPLGLVWSAATAAAMLALAYGKRRVGTALANPVLIAASRVTLVDALLAGAVLVGLALNAALDWWWADPAAGLVIVVYALREARTIYAQH